MNQHKTSDYDKLMHSKRWLLLRRQKLTEHPTCELCEKEGRVTLASEVHHIQPIEDAFFSWQQEGLAYNYANLMAVCSSCHKKLHKEMGRSGKEYTKKKNEAHLAQFRKKFFG